MPSLQDRGEYVRLEEGSGSRSVCRARCRECCTRRTICYWCVGLSIIAILAGWLYFAFFSGCLLLC